MKTILIVALILTACFVRADRRSLLLTLNQPTQSGSSLTPTNLPGETTLGWWVADDLTTNAGVQTLPDRWANGWDLTNSASTTTWPIVGPGKNSHKTLTFSVANSTYLRNELFTNAQPTEYVILASVTNVTAGNQTLFSGVNASFRNFFRVSSSLFQLYAGTVASTFSAGAATTNTWMMFTVAFDGASSFATTNTVSGGTLNPGTQTMSGITLGNSDTLVFPAQMEFAEIVAYAGILSSLNRSNNCFYFTNKYEISGVVIP